MSNIFSIGYNLLFIKWLRRIFRLILLTGHILAGLLLSFIIFSPLFHKKKRWQRRIVGGWSRILCRICGLQVQCHGSITKAPALFVANHISWLDIFALLGTFEVLFVSKQEVQNWPVLGWLVERVGTLFIRRGDFGASKQVSNVISEALGKNSNVLFFPEGTSTDGTSVRRFHARLFQAAIDTGILVQPVALRYRQGENISLVVPYIGQDTLFGNLWRILGETGLRVELWFCPPISAHEKKRRDLSDYAQAQVQKVIVNC
jgi:lyso-ornithine lipid O-acyltransferase